ncbi:MAG: glycosyltransferase [Chloroflexi bacterium]|nr:glycosyltransferase [Chloroflexota bacterium]
MRIAHLIDNLYQGGAQRMLAMLTHELPRSEVETVVVSLNHVNDKAYYARQIQDDGIEVVPITGNGLLDLNRIRRLALFLRERKIDLVHLHLSYASILGVMVGGLTGLPVAATLYSTGLDRRLYHPIRYYMETLALQSRRCNVVACGYSVANAQQSRVGRRKKIEVIPNAMSVLPDLPPLERQKLRASLTKRDEGVILITVGRLIPDKGYSDMLIAFEKISRTNPEVSLLIVGNGDLKDTLQEQIRSLGIEGRAFLLGPQDDIPSLLSASDMYISASHREGMSMSLLEAMAAGLPTVTTDVGDASMMFTDATGILVEPHNPDRLADAVNALLSDPARMKSMGCAAREHLMAHYGLETWTNKYITLYSHILKNNGRG